MFDNHQMTLLDVTPSISNFFISKFKCALSGAIQARDERYLERYPAQCASFEIVSARQTSPTISVLLLSHERRCKFGHFDVYVVWSRPTLHLSTTCSLPLASMEMAHQIQICVGSPRFDQRASEISATFLHRLQFLPSTCRLRTAHPSSDAHTAGTRSRRYCVVEYRKTCVWVRPGTKMTMRHHVAPRIGMRERR
jgi:hypothetical protein